jgi:hypothetical protein
VSVFAVATIGAEGCAESDSTGPSKAEESATTSPGKNPTPKREATTIDSASASGDYAIAQAAGEIDDPGTINVRVTSKPRQKVDVTWALVCVQTGGAGTKDGQFSGRTPLTKALKKPAKKVSSCTVSANAQLAEGGKVTVRISG